MLLTKKLAMGSRCSEFYMVDVLLIVQPLPEEGSV